MSAPDRAALVRMFELATRIKEADEKFRVLISSGQAMIMYYSPRGQEIIAAATGAVLGTDDYVVTTYRGLHDHVAKGVPLGPLFAEFLGRATGTCKGKGGGMHITHPPSGLMVTTGIVGGGLPVANGLAIAAQLRGDGRVTVCNFGDGASNIGAFHEALNLASVWKLPVVFLCQNNRYAEHTPFVKGTSVPHVSDRSVAYSIPGVAIDGNDPRAMYSALAEAVARARAGEGPTLVEAHTFRFMGHYFGDAMAYIPKDEMQAALAADPMPAFRSWLINEGDVGEDELKAIEEQARSDVEEAAAFALGSPFPDPADIRFDVYAQEVTS